jgi:hypothetical protein
MKTRTITPLSAAFRISLICIFLTSAIRPAFACNLQLNAAATYNCTGNGKDGNVTLTIANGTAPYIVIFNGNKQTDITATSLAFSGLAAGTYSYSVTDANACVASGSIILGRNILPAAKVTTAQTICASAGKSIALGFAPVSGNSYSWTSNPAGFSSASSNPSVSPSASTTYTIKETNPNGCSKSNSVTITVNPIPTVTISAATTSICVGGNTIALSGTPYGGIFAGDGITDSTFDPSYAGVGDHTIAYSYTDGNGCTNTASTVITVLPLPSLSIKSPYTNICIDGGSFGLTGTPSGGIFAGDGISDTTFDPVSAGLGGHSIIYIYSNGSGCTFSETIDITVNPLPTVTLNPVSVCLNNGKFSIQSTPSGNGAVFSGNGVNGNVFDPAAAGVGQHTINFVYTDSNGCSNATSATFTVLPLPSVSLGSFSDVCINNGSFTLTGGSPSGGTYSGEGITSGIFDPSAAGTGAHTITYTVIGSNGCSNSTTSSINVLALPVITLSSKTVCIDAGKFTVNASPAGGTLSGAGISGTTFDPASAGAGAHTITYTYTDGNGCTNSATATFTVNALPSVSISSYNPVCINSGSFAISGSPSGGTFSGNGVSYGIFDPVKAGTGNSTITYTYTNSNGCTNSASTSITVNAAPSVTISSYNPVCISSGSFSLSGSPSGGSFSGDGVSGNTFNPATAGAGTHSITYSYTDGNGCTATATTSITVNALPTVNISAHTPVCIDGGSFSLSASPSGGTFSGTGVSGSTFNPSISGTGTFTLSYNYTDGNGCSNSASTNVKINPLPTVIISAINATCISCGKVSLSGSPTGGTFSGTGVSGSTFDPSVSGTGTFTIKYSYSDNNGCSNTATKDITVTQTVPVSITSHNPVCVNDGSFTLSGSPSGGTFSGNGVSGNTFTPSDAGAGNQTITYTYNNSTASTVITVNALPTVSISSYSTVCVKSSSISLSGTPAGGTFSGDGISAGIFNPSDAGVGTHTITYTYTNSSGCTASATTTITVTDVPTASITASGPSTFCSGGSVILSAGSGDSYSWSNSNGPLLGASNQTLNVTKSGTYFVTVTSNGCSNTSAGTTITVNPTPAASAGSDITYYHGYDDCPSLSGSSSISGSTYLWSTSSTKQTITVCPTATTVYSLTVSKNGCTSAKDSVTVTVIDVRCHDEDDVNKSGKDKDKKENEKKEKEDKVIMCHKGKSLCVDKDDVKDHLKHGDKLGTCGSGEMTPGTLNITDQFLVFPNPFTQSTNLRISFAKEQQVNIELWSMDGKLINRIFAGNTNAGAPYNFTIDGSNMVPGIYFIKVIGSENVEYQKIELAR